MSGNMAMLIRAMEREEHESGVLLMEQVFSPDLKVLTGATSLEIATRC